MLKGLFKKFHKKSRMKNPRFFYIKKAETDDGISLFVV